jgi:hypothetical protein
MSCYFDICSRARTIRGKLTGIYDHVSIDRDGACVTGRTRHVYSDGIGAIDREIPTYGIARHCQIDIGCLARAIPNEVVEILVGVARFAAGDIPCHLTR